MFKNYRLHIILFSLMIAGLFAANSLSMGISEYFPVVLGVIALSFLALLRWRFKIRIEHYLMLIMVLVGILQLNSSLDFIDDSLAVFSFPIFFALFIGITLIPVKKEELKLIADSFLFSGLMIALLIVFVRYDYGAGRISVQIKEGYPVDPNYLSAFLVSPCIIALKRFLFPIGGQSRFFYAPLLFFILLALFLTGSRAAMLAFGAAGFIILIRKPVYILPSALAAGLLVFFTVSFLPQNIYERLFISSYNDGSNQKRLWLWSVALNVWLERPLFGYGLVNTKFLLNIGNVAHNTFLSFLLRFGLVGTLSFLGICYKIFINSFSKDMLSVMALFFALMFTAFIIEQNTSLSFWSVFTFLTLCVNFKKDNPHEQLWNLV